jgi:hypothetical protein
MLQFPTDSAAGSQPGANHASENSQQDNKEYPGVDIVKEAFRIGTSANRSSAFIRTNMSHAAN